MPKPVLTIQFLTDDALTLVRRHVSEYYGMKDEDDFNCLIATVGLPRAGKTTWSRQLGVPMVNPDHVRMAMHGQPYLREMEELVWWQAKIMVKALFYAGHHTVVLDSCLNTVRRRQSWSTNSTWLTAFCHLKATPEQCLQRANQTARPDLIEVIREQARTFMPPSDIDAGALIDIV